MSSAVLVFLGGGLGSLLRWAIDRIRPAEYLPNPLDLYLDELPGATIIVNVIGCFVFGFIINLPPEFMGEKARLFFTVGLAGGFTTYSAFAGQTFLFLQQGEPAMALGNVAVTLTFGLLAVALGFTVASWL